MSKHRDPNMPKYSVRRGRDGEIYGGVIIDPPRRMRPVGRPSQVDDKDAISQDLSADSSDKALALSIVTTDETNDEETRREGQCGMFLEDGVIVPITTKDSFPASSADNTKDDSLVLVASIRIPMLSHQHARDFDAPPKSVRAQFSRSAESSTMIIKGKPVKNHHLLEPQRLFERVTRDDFEIQVGQKIGMVIYSEVGATPSNAHAKSLSQEQITAIFGPPCVVTVYTGNITKVNMSERFIEHDINTYESCSGGIIFLLDKNQPASILSEDHGKAIAVHSEFLSDENVDGGNVAVLL